MDYEKKYKDALEWAKKVMQGKVGFVLDDVLEKFPELKESENEKTKRILHSISSKMSFHLCDIFTEEEFQCFDTWSNAWLEKQADHAKFINSIQVGDKVTRNKDGMLVNLSQLNRVAKKDEKQGEQKPNFCHHEVDLSGCSDEYCKAYYDGWNNCNQQHAQLEAEKKPTEWSEEDEINLGKAIWYVENPAPTVAKDSMLVEWLKSLKDRVQLQPKQEWSEEDEKLTNRIEGWLDTLCEYLKDVNSPECIEDVKDILERLKSLKDRYAWKPSDEQLAALANALSLAKNCGEESAFELSTLYDVLKKLREE